MPADDIAAGEMPAGVAEAPAVPNGVGPPLPTVIGTATSRMTRVLFVGAAVTGIAFAALSARIAFSQLPYLQPAWGVASLVALWAGPVLLAVTALWAPLRMLRALSYTYVAVYLAALLTWPLAMNVERMPGSVAPWLIILLPMAAFSAAVVLPAVGAWAVLAVGCVGAGFVRYLADGRASASVALQDTAFNAMTVGVFVAIIIVTLRAARRRDDIAARNAADAIVTAAAEAQDLQRAQVAALTHDDVISTLIAAARATDASAPLVRRYAARALERLDALSATDEHPDARATGSDVVSTLRETVSALSVGVAFTSSVNDDLDVPATVERALADATAEAVRNSVRHGGSAANRQVRVELTDAGARVVVADDGEGFEESDLSPERFGIRYSIRHRMALVPGGGATIDSHPGVGTRVTLTWDRERADAI
jgi:signal transduction histidine kinase